MDSDGQMVNGDISPSLMIRFIFSTPFEHFHYHAWMWWTDIMVLSETVSYLNSSSLLPSLKNVSQNKGHFQNDIKHKHAVTPNQLWHMRIYYTVLSELKRCNLWECFCLRGKAYWRKTLAERALPWQHCRLQYLLISDVKVQITTLILSDDEPCLASPSSI